MTDALIDSLEVLSNILSIVHDTALSDSMKVDIIQNEIEHFLNRHEEGKGLSTVIAFIIGLIVGGVMGMLCAAIMSADRRDDNDDK